MSEKGQSRKSMFVPVKNNMEELRRLYNSDTPVLAYAFKRRTVEGWTPEHSHARGQLVALTHGVLIVEAGSERWMHPSQRCAWIPPNCKHAARSVGGAAGAMVDLSPEMCRGLPKTPCLFNSSDLLFAIVHRMVDWDPHQPLSAAKKHLVTTLRDEIRQPDPQPLRLTIPTEERLARVADAVLNDVGDDRTLDAWAQVAGMSRRILSVRFRPRRGCHLAAGGGEPGCLRPLRCWHKRNRSRRSRSQSGITASVLSLKCFAPCWGPHRRHTFKAVVRDPAVDGAKARRY